LGDSAPARGAIETSRLLDALATPRRVALATFIVYLALALTKLAVHHFDASYFVMAGERFCDRRATPPSLTIPRKNGIEVDGGYDGQFCYRFALNPFTNRPVEFGIGLDLPSYRHQRILNSFIVHLLSFGGQPKVVLYDFIALDLAGAAALAWLFARMAKLANAHPAWGLVVAVYPGFLISFSRNLVELTSCAFMLAGLLAARSSRWWTTALLMFLGILARETTLFVPFALAVVQGGTWLLDRAAPRARAFIEKRLGPLPKDPSFSAVAASAAPLVGFLAWQVILRFVWGVVPALENRGSLRLPLVGIGRFVIEAIQHAYVLDLVQWAMIVGQTVVVARALRRSMVPIWEKLAWVLWAILLSMLSERDHWADQASYLRITGELFLLGTLILLATSPRKMPRMYLAWGALSAFQFAIAADLFKL